MFTKRRIARVLKWLTGLAATAALVGGLTLAVVDSAQATGDRYASCRIGSTEQYTTMNIHSWLNSNGTRTWHLGAVDKTYSTAWYPQIKSIDFYGARNGRTGTFYSGNDIYYTSGTTSSITWTGYAYVVTFLSTYKNVKSCSATA